MSDGKSYYPSLDDTVGGGYHHDGDDDDTGKDAGDESSFLPHSLEDQPMGGDKFDYGPNKYRDKWWAVLFFLHIAAMIVLAVTYGGDLITYLKEYSAEAETADDEIATTTVLYALVFGALAAGLFSSCWLKIMDVYASVIIKISLLATGTLLFVFATICLVGGQVFVACVFFLLAALQCLYFYMVRRRIAFTQALISASVTAIMEHPSPIYVVYAMMVAQVLWIGFWCFTFMAVLYYVNGQSFDSDHSNVSGVGGLTCFVLLISLYWTMQVLKNIGHVTTAGTVASWWLVPSMSDPAAGALSRALTTSFGSICFGSLVVAILSAIRAMLNIARNNARKRGGGGAACIFCCLECIVSCIESLMVYFNMYAYTMVAIYGVDFISAAKKTWELFKASGFDMLINDDLTGMVLFMGSVLGGCIAGIVGGALVYFSETNTGWGLVAGLAFLGGFLIASMMMNVVESAVATTYVCRAEDPETTAYSRPAAYNKIAEAARDLHPGRGAVF